MIQLRFVEGGGWESHIIRHASRCRWSHVEALALDAKRTFGAQLNGGVRWRDLDDACYRRAVAYQTVTIPCTGSQYQDFWTFLLAQMGKPYDWRAIASFALGERDWRGPGWFCSELMIRGLLSQRLLYLPYDTPVTRIVPAHLWMMLAGRSSISPLTVQMKLGGESVPMFGSVRLAH